MRKILNFGSLNIDYVYEVPHFVRAGETLAATGYNVFCGGKGLNQSIALSRAGAKVYHAGVVGQGSELLIKTLEKNNVDTLFIREHAGASGHAIIQRDLFGQNSILIYNGANHCISNSDVEKVLSHFSADDFIVLQNEINMVDTIIKKAKKKDMKVFFNPSPMVDDIRTFPFGLVDVLLLNEVEGSDMSGQSEPAKILNVLSCMYPQSAIILTLGEQGVLYIDHSLEKPLSHIAYSVKVADTTAAGDTFCGYFIARLAAGDKIEEILRIASVASSISVSRHGAEPSIPYLDEVLNKGF